MKHALIFAAGRGVRMGHLTDHTPKPLLQVGGKRLIEWILEKLAAAGYRKVVINTSHLAEQFPAILGDGSRWGVTIQYAYEGPTALETGGGMLHALSMLDTESYLAINADVWCDVDLSTLPAKPAGLAHLLLVDNPPQHPHGDFVLGAAGVLADEGEPRLTFSGIGVYRSDLLNGWREVIGTPDDVDNAWPRFKLVPLLRAAMHDGQVSGHHHAGVWSDVGTPARLDALRAELSRTG